MVRLRSAARIIALGWQQNRVLVAGGSGRHCHRGHALSHQNGQIEHAETNRDHEKPSIHFPGNPLEAKQVVFHRDLTQAKMDANMLQRNIKLPEVIESVL
jgi:hypothetical protein